MLLLLEDEWLFNSDGLRDLRHKMLKRYVGEYVRVHQLVLFLLNDIIRYYRTVAVDYELYAGGLFSVAMTAHRTREDKIAVLERLFEMPLIDRMLDICGRQKMEAVLSSYNKFLARLEECGVRCHLKELRKEQRDDPLFRELKNEGHRFTGELLRLFEDVFDPTHPIRRAVVF